MTTDRAVDEPERVEGVEVRPVAGHVGAEITGVDLAGPLDQAVVALIRQAVLRWKVVFYQGRALASPLPGVFQSREALRTHFDTDRVPRRGKTRPPSAL
jgi:taurine dioxygenase